MNEIGWQTHTTIANLWICSQTNTGLAKCHTICIYCHIFSYRINIVCFELPQYNVRFIANFLFTEKNGQHVGKTLVLQQRPQQQLQRRSEIELRR
jgi:hypothetical protein